MNSTIVLGIISIALAIAFRTQTDAYPATAQRLPLILLWLVGALAVMMIFEDFFQRRQARQGSPAQPDSDDAPIAPIHWAALCAFAAAIVVYVALIPVVGYLVTTTTFITGSLLVSRIMAPAMALLIGVLTTAGVWALFIWALNLPVPILPFLN